MTAREFPPQLDAGKDLARHSVPSYDPQLAQFPFLSLPSEIVSRISTFWTDNRLGLPTSAFNTDLAAILRDPSVIAARVLRRFTYPTSALVAECGRHPADVAVVRVLLDELQRRGGVVTPDKLEIAAYRGDHALAMLLLDRGAPGIDRALAAAAEKGYDETVSALLARGAKADSFSPIGESALVLACKNGHLEIVKMLLNHGADPYPGVAVAVSAGRGDIRDLLFRAGAGTRPDYDAEALHQAASGGHVDLVRELLQRGANPDGVDGRPLRSACVVRRLDVVQCLVEGGADVNVIHGWPLDIAVTRGYGEIVTYLLANGARPKSGYVFKAAQKNHFDVVKALVGAGTPWDQGMTRGLEMQGCSEAILEYLRQH